jgi:hypothetical protein
MRTARDDQPRTSCRTRCSALTAVAGPGSRRFGRKRCEDPASSADKLVRAVQQFPVNRLVYPVAALPGAEAEFALPRGREKQAALVKAPAAEHASHFQALDGTKSILGVYANLVFGLAHNRRLPVYRPPAGTSPATVVASSELW